MKPVRRASSTTPREVVADAAEGLEVLVHQPARLARVDPQLLAEAERRQAVGQAVVHRLDLGPLPGGDLVGGRRRRPATAVIEWKSCPDLNASISRASSDRWAMIRISIWL